MDDDKYLKPTRSLASSAGELAKAVVRSGSPKSRKSEEEEVDEGVGVYDTSHKKRVPSWLVSSSTFRNMILTLFTGVTVSFGNPPLSPNQKRMKKRNLPHLPHYLYRLEYVLATSSMHFDHEVVGIHKCPSVAH